MHSAFEMARPSVNLTELKRWKAALRMSSHVAIALSKLVPWAQRRASTNDPWTVPLACTQHPTRSDHSRRQMLSAQVGLSASALLDNKLEHRGTGASVEIVEECRVQWDVQ